MLPKIVGKHQVNLRFECVAYIALWKHLLKKIKADEIQNVGIFVLFKCGFKE